MHRRQLPWILPLLLLLGTWTSWKQAPESALEPMAQVVVHPPLREISGQSDPLLDALDRGQALKLTVAGEETNFLFRRNPLLGDSFRVSLGAGKLASWERPTTFTGWAFSQQSRFPATLTVVEQQGLGTWLLDDGTLCQFTWILGNNEVALTRIREPARQGILEESADGRRQCRLSEASPPASVSPPRQGTIALEIAAQGGLEPATGEVARYLDPLPFSESYARSLKDLDLVLVLDQSATGPNEPTSLALIASQWLATVANVATIYENQLGIRLRLQELILIPDDPTFTDITSTNVLNDFRLWMAANRPLSQYQWQTAIKVGSGLTASNLGLAWVAALGTSTSVGTIRPDTGWGTLAHEIGHTLGANHTIGGLMNGQANGGGDRDFFTEVSSTRGWTATREIYEHSAEHLRGEAHLRNPLEMPFAKNDFRVLAADQDLVFDPTQNDQRAVRFGATNGALSVNSVSVIRPAEAGTLSHDGKYIHFSPSEGFRGLVWFSYALQGSIGNGGQGWLHKGDVTLVVGNDIPQEELMLVPGESRTFSSNGASGTITQPRAALIHRLIDDDRLVIRASPDASGSDAFMIGSTRFEITYSAAKLTTTPDAYWHHSGMGALIMHPLSNDIASSTSGVIAKPAPSQSHLFPEALRLISAENLSPDKGDLEIEQAPVTVNGEPSESPSGTLKFTAIAGATGNVTLRYTVADPAGLTATEFISIRLAGKSFSLISPQSVARYHIPRTSFDAVDWNSPAFSDRSWPTGSLPIGYEDGKGYEDVILTDVGNQMVAVNSTLYARMRFTLNSTERVSRLVLRLRMDDGFIAYLNGTEVVRENVPDETTWDSAAIEGVEASDFIDYDITEASSLLRQGENLLAIHGMNAQISSSDFLLMPELLALTLPSIAEISSPKAESVSVPIGTGLVFSYGRTTDELALVSVIEPISTHWQIVSAPRSANVEPDYLPDGRLAVVFPQAGTYHIRLTAKDASGLTTEDECTVRVNETLPYDQITDQLNVDPAIITDTLRVTLTSNVVSAVPGRKSIVTWQQLQGPAPARIAEPDAPVTEVEFPRSGRYEMRVYSTVDGITLFGDVQVDVQTGTQLLVHSGSHSLYHYGPTTDSPSQWQWQWPDFDDHTWFHGGQGLGYDVIGALSAYVDTNLRSSIQFIHAGVFVRYPFTIENVASVYALELQLRADDGAVVYLNGQEVYRENAPLYDLSLASSAVRSVDETSLEDPPWIDLAAHRRLLRPGYNTLAIHGLNISSSSSDFLIQPTLRAKLGLGAMPPPEIGEGEILTEILGPNPTPSVTIEGESVRVTFLSRADLDSLSGRIDLETSANLTDWQRWPFQSREVLSEGNGMNRIILTGTRTQAAQYMRLRVSF